MQDKFFEYGGIILSQSGSLQSGKMIFSRLHAD